LCQPYFGFWLFGGQIVKKRNKKDSWYQDYFEGLTLAHPGAPMKPSAFVTKTARQFWSKKNCLGARNIRTQAVSIFVERTITQRSEIFVFLQFQLNLDHFWYL